MLASIGNLACRIVASASSRTFSGTGSGVRLHGRMLSSASSDDGSTSIADTLSSSHALGDSLDPADRSGSPAVSPLRAAVRRVRRTHRPGAAPPNGSSAAQCSGCWHSTSSSRYRRASCRRPRVCCSGSAGSAVVWSGMMAGCLLGYATGAPGSASGRRFIGEDGIARASRLMQRYGDLTLVLCRRCRCWRKPAWCSPAWCAPTDGRFLRLDRRVEPRHRHRIRRRRGLLAAPRIRIPS